MRFKFYIFFFNDRSNVEIAGKLYDEIVANVPGAIIETSAGEPGERRLT